MHCDLTQLLDSASKPLACASASASDTSNSEAGMWASKMQREMGEEAGPKLGKHE